MATRAAKTLRILALLTFYVIALGTSLWVSYQLRFDFTVPAEYWKNFPTILAGMLLVKMVLLLLFGQFGSLLTYFGLYDLVKIFFAMVIASVVALAVWMMDGATYAPPRAVIVTDLVFSFLALSSLRMAFRVAREGYFSTKSNATPLKRVGIIGAGDVGAALARDLLARRGLGMTPRVFFDDQKSKWGTTIHGILVYGNPESLPEYLRRHPLDEMVIAMPSAAGRRVREIVTLLNSLRLRFEIVPSYEQLLRGQVRVSQIRPIEIEDLLGREPVNLQTERIRDLVRDKIVMVTGAGGTIGAELCRQIASHGPRELLLVERSEYLLFQTEQELRQLGFGSEIVSLVADILDEVRMRGIFHRFAPAIVFHAAAHKHVPMMEIQPAEAFRNNVGGTRLITDLALEFKVARFVLISTDKAINPTSVMGATKRIAEIYLQALQKDAGSDATRFMAVRFGNVLGSSGSVIPTFKKQIATGGPVTVTHPDVTRYFMTVNEAVGLVLQSATLGAGGEIFVLDMGQPMKIADLARQLIELSGLQPDVDIEIQFTGLRPGEKLFEELNHNTENHVPTEHAKIMRFVGSPHHFAPLRDAVVRLQKDCPGMETDGIKRAIRDLVPEYHPHLGAI